jgi:putative polyhydroxyalkanoate system protein
MSEILLRRAHGLSLSEAKHLAETIARQLRDDFGGSYAWEGDRLCFRRAGASGDVAVTPEEIEIRVNISFLLSPLHARIEREIVTFCDEHLGRPAPRDRRQPARPTASRSRPMRSSRSHGASRSGRPK